VSVLLRTAGLLRPAWSRLVLAAVLAALASGCAVALMATSAWLIVRAAQHPPVLTLLVAVVAVRTFGIGRGVLRYVERLVSHDAAFAALVDVRVQVVRALERLAPAGLPAWRQGDLLARMVSDVDDVQDLALRGFLPVASAGLVCAATLGLALVLLPSAALVLAVALVLAGVLTPWLWTRAARRSEDGLAGVRADRSATVVELLDAATDLAACGAQQQWLERVDALEAQVELGVARAARIAGVGVGTALLAVGAAVWGTVVVGVPAVRGGSLTGPALAVLVLTPLALTELVQALPAAAQQLQRVRASAARVLAVLDAPAPVPETAHPAALPAGAHLQLAGVDVTWPEAAGAGGTGPVLRGVDLDLSPGRRVAITGPSGSGKSTLLAALLRFVEPSAGTITLDGVDVRTLDADAVRTRIALCDQEAHVFDSSIAENVRLARAGATDTEVRAALDAARLGPWIDTLPDGVHTRVGEHGALVSGGQRQRLALARALLADRPVLLLDEPTAGLDEPTAAALVADLLAAGTHRTTVLVTHREVSLEDVDEIVVLAGGRVVGRRTRDAVPRDRVS
jgi:thiol reductant ABC exporter CydC subunit